MVCIVWRVAAVKPILQVRVSKEFWCQLADGGEIIEPKYLRAL
jgi:hypothetical protein